ncbi:methylated-DNA--[protein]-cysteine S-methyltransferase [Streptomyces sp. NPDC049954]|uniref:methylated-DNA--[protein]-cysteine S-methyltransferase n=1 Tax=Streptomyces sp. NPDC049954 TaxID=3155779 RepID=UPI0034135651
MNSHTRSADRGEATRGGDGESPGGGASAGGPGPAGWSWSVLRTPIGPLLLAATGTGLLRVVFHAGEEIREAELERLTGRLGGAADPVSGQAVLAAARAEFEEYFAGRRTRFTLPLDWSLTTGFHRQVLRELESGVPFGSVVGYGDLARRVGQPGAAQAVGIAMGANPLPVVVPCHRVVERDGGIGGFGGGVETKRRLLELEGVLPQPLF